MGILDALRSPGHGKGDTLYECRNCGMTVSYGSDECPECGSAEIATYDL